MRILAIRGKNLASLQRSFEVDFARGPLAGVGLFAITGPVGAGKSTLLDALCLALFDRTPRLSGRGGVLVGEDSEARGDWLRSSDPRSLLRRDAAEGHAEADFTGRDGVRYRARWSVRRARRRHDGRVQEQEMTLFDLDRGLLVAGGRKTEVLAAIEARLGLDFGQFCRSVLLAQGEFAAFLRASADERARLLENLTGADVYRQLSRAAHEARKRRETELANLAAQANAQVLLGDAEHEVLVQRAQELEQELRMCQLGIEIAQGYLAWYRAATGLRQRESEATVSLQEAVAAVHAAVARRERHTRLVRALPLVPRVEIVMTAQGELTRGIAALGDAEGAVEQAQRLVDDAARRLKQELDGWWPGALVPPIVREFERWAATVQRWFDAAQALGAAEADLPRAQERAAACVLGVAVAEVAVQRATSLLQAAEQAERVLRAEAAAPEFLDLAKTRRQLAKTGSVLRAQHDRFVVWQARTREQVAAQATAALRLQERDAAAEGFAGLVALRDAAERTLLAARRQCDAVRSRVDLAQFRHSLTEGAPCPLCGSLAHPDPVHAHDAELAAAKATVAGTEADFDAARQVVTERELLRTAAERAHAVAERTLAAATPMAEAARAAWTQVVDGSRAAMDVAAAGAWIEADTQRLAASEQEFEKLAAAADAARTAHDRAVVAERQAAAEMRKEGARLQAAMDAVVATRHAVEVAAAECERRRGTLCELGATIAPAFAGIDDWEDAMRVVGTNGLARLRSLAQIEQQRAVLATARDVATTARAAAATEAARLQAEMVTARSTFESALHRDGVQAVDVREAAEVGSVWLREEGEALQELEVVVQRRRAVLQTCAEMRRRHETDERPAIEEGDATQAYDDARTSRDRVQTQLGDVRATLAADDLLRRQRDELAPRIAAVEQSLHVWRALDDLIGSSGGDAFVVFAQGLTLDLLLTEANRRLAELARRYRLHKNPGSEMDFVVVDLDLGGTRRSLQSLSGGETFLVSLALALALATLAAPRSRVETLFLDEGFGTLDAQNLEMALGALDTLQASGCQVGVISHVDGIAERIGAVVEVQPEGGGQSRVLARVR